MEQNVYGSSPEESILGRVREGMKVVDREGNQVGDVKEVRFGDQSATAPGRGPATTEGQGEIENDPSGFSDFAVGFGRKPDDEPESDLIKKQMQLSGYLRVSASGLFSGERFVMPEHIDKVAEDEVLLSVKEDDLPKR
jgi:hypothetical protein